MKDEAERRFPHKIDIPVPHTGLGRDLTAMLELCRAWVPRPARPRKGEPRPHCARRYFADAADAEAFRRQWLDGRVILGRAH